MHILSFTTLFPNHLQPNFSIFVKQRISHVSRIANNEARVIAPVPYCPSWFRMEPWYRYARIHKMEQIDGIDVHHPRYPLVPKVSMVFHALSLWATSWPLVRLLEKSFRFDLIDAHYVYPDGLAAILLGRMCRKPVVISARGSDIHQFSRFMTIQPMIRFALSKATEIISVCLALKNEMIALGAAPDKIKVIPNGVDIHRFRILNREECRKKLSINENHKAILSVGNLVPVKGFDYLIQAVAMLTGQHNDVHLYIVGKGPLREGLLETARILGVADRIKLVGEQPNEELADYYNAADVFCLASSHEGWANVIMESLACGTPVVATNVYGAPEIITTDKVGILVERNPKAIADGVTTALDSKWNRQAIRNHVAGRTWDAVGHEVMDVFQRAVRNF